MLLRSRTELHSFHRDVSFLHPGVGSSVYRHFLEETTKKIHEENDGCNAALLWSKLPYGIADRITIEFFSLVVSATRSRGQSIHTCLKSMM